MEPNLLEELKTYLRIDGSEDDAILTLLVEAAEEYLKDAGVPESKQETKRYRLAVILYVSNHYENRNPGQKIEQFNFALQSIILQLKE